MRTLLIYTFPNFSLGTPAHATPALPPDAFIMDDW